MNKMSIYKPITVTAEWSILAKMNGMSFPGESRLIVQPDHMALAVGFQQKSRMQFIRRKECRAGRNYSYPPPHTFANPTQNPANQCEKADQR